MKDSLVQELQQKAEKTELLQVELQMLETERVRLSLVEEKLVDILQLLQQLRDLVSPSPAQRSSILTADGSGDVPKVLSSGNGCHVKLKSSLPFKVKLQPGCN